MYKLYWSRDTGAFAPQAVLEEIGADYEKIVVDTKQGAHRTSEFLQINPRGQIPALALPDGSVMTESVSMVLHLADCHPEAGLQPPPGDPARAQLYRWLLFFATNLYDADLRYVYSDRYTTEESGIPGVRAKAAEDLERGFSLVNHALDAGPYLLGERFSTADIYLLMLSYWHPEQNDIFEKWPRVRQVCDLARERPAIARVCAEHY